MSILECCWQHSTGEMSSRGIKQWQRGQMSSSYIGAQSAPRALMAFTHAINDRVCVARPEAWSAGTKLLEDLKKKKGKVVTPNMG